MKLSIFVPNTSSNAIVITVTLVLLVLLGIRPLLMKKLQRKTRRQLLAFTQRPITSYKAEANYPFIRDEQTLPQSNRGRDPNRKRFFDITSLNFSLNLDTEDLFISVNTVSGSVNCDEISNYS